MRFFIQHFPAAVPSLVSALLLVRSELSLPSVAVPVYGVGIFFPSGCFQDSLWFWTVSLGFASVWFCLGFAELLGCVS